MKWVRKGPTPKSLSDFLITNPEATWEEVSNQNAQVAHDCRDQAIREQGNLCAYCEQRISSDDLLHRRIEHFHPKSDKSTTRNWGLDWQNMLAVCDGGSESLQAERKLHPLPANLSCDAHKDRMIQTRKIPVECEGYLMNPLEVPIFPNVFAFVKGTWCLVPNEGNCAAVEFPINACKSTKELVCRTIEVLNLNCNRLTDNRRYLVYNIERNKKKLRERGYTPQDMPKKLVERYFTSKWPEYFTTLRCILGTAAEDYLQFIDYCG